MGIFHQKSRAGCEYGTNSGGAVGGRIVDLPRRARMSDEIHLHWEGLTMPSSTTPKDYYLGAAFLGFCCLCSIGYMVRTSEPKDVTDQWNVGQDRRGSYLQREFHYEKQRDAGDTIFGWVAVIGSGGAALWCWARGAKLAERARLTPDWRGQRTADDNDEDEDFDEDDEPEKPPEPLAGAAEPEKPLPTGPEAQESETASEPTAEAPCVSNVPRIDAMTVDDRRWIPCSGCSGEIGLPPDWKEETALCPKCGTSVPILASQPEVQWRPRSEPAVKTAQLDSSATAQSAPYPAPGQTDLPANGYAVTGLSLGIASVFLYFIGIIPLLAIIFSGIGLAKVKERQGKGQVQAWIGLVLGIVFSILCLSYYGHLQ